jgi:hypothetical protein
MTIPPDHYVVIFAFGLYGFVNGEGRIAPKQDD